MDVVVAVKELVVVVNDAMVILVQRRPSGRPARMIVHREFSWWLGLFGSLVSFFIWTIGFASCCGLEMTLFVVFDRLVLSHSFPIRLIVSVVRCSILMVEDTTRTLGGWLRSFFVRGADVIHA